jgi:hypothetical protein
MGSTQGAHPIGHAFDGRALVFASVVRLDLGVENFSILCRLPLDLDGYNHHAVSRGAALVTVSLVCLTLLVVEFIALSNFLDQLKEQTERRKKKQAFLTGSDSKPVR